MNILGIDTSTKHMSIGLVSNDVILGEIIFNSNMDHSEKLITNLSYILDSNDMKIGDIDLIGVAKGPGSFTGIRIGIATVKGLAEFTDIPVVGVSSLEALSRNFMYTSPVAIAVDAKRDRVYGAIYGYNEENHNVLLQEGMYDIDVFKDYVRKYKPSVIAGDINAAFNDEFDYEIKFSSGLDSLNHGANICFIAKREFDAGNHISHLELGANYMSKSQAQVDMEKKNGKI